MVLSLIHQLSQSQHKKKEGPEPLLSQPNGGLLCHPIQDGLEAIVPPLGLSLHLLTLGRLNLLDAHDLSAIRANPSEDRGRVGELPVAPATLALMVDLQGGVELALP